MTTPEATNSDNNKMSFSLEGIEHIAVNAARRAATECVEDAANQAARRAALTGDEIHHITREVVHQTLLEIGVQFSDPIEMQRDFQHLRQWRRAGEDLRSKGILTLLGIFIAGLVGLIVVGFRTWLHLKL